MENKIGVSISLKKQTQNNLRVAPKTFRKRYDKRRQPYLLPCGNTKEFCFLQVSRKNATFCRVWRKIVWAKCRHAIFTEKYKWEER